MLLRQMSSGHMVEVANLVELINLNCDEVSGQYQEGEDLQESVRLKKSDLMFLSGEALPQCWRDPHYRDDELMRK
ncbi:MAG: acetyltransferase [Gammaproteobacteria bacterium]|nr:MAG: acetyltransferase [Gammaproteobacteria bacterium]